MLVNQCLKKKIGGGANCVPKRKEDLSQLHT